MSDPKTLKDPSQIKPSDSLDETGSLNPVAADSVPPVSEISESSEILSYSSSHTADASIFGAYRSDEALDEWDEEYDGNPMEAEVGANPETPGKLALEEVLSTEAKLEAMIFASPNPMKASEILEVLQDETLTTQRIESVLDGLCKYYENRAGGFKLEYLKGLGYQFRSVAAAAPIMERMFATRPRPISRAALETLAIIAYRQPVTRAQVERVRGVDAGSIIKNLLDRNLVACVGRKEDSGRPMLFGTTDEFLKVFRLDSLKDLPPLESFQIKKEVLEEALAKLDGADSVDLEEFVGDQEKNPDSKVDFDIRDSLEASGGELDPGGENFN